MILDDESKLKIVIESWVETNSTPVTWELFIENLKELQFMDLVLTV